MLTVVIILSDEAVAAFLEASGGSMNELSLNNVEKVTSSPIIYYGLWTCNRAYKDLFFLIYRVHLTE